MWYEYLIIIGMLAAAVAYVGRIVYRAWAGTGGCGSGTCRCDAPPRANADGKIKVTPLVSLRTPEE